MGVSGAVALEIQKAAITELNGTFLIIIQREETEVSSKTRGRMVKIGRFEKGRSEGRFRRYYVINTSYHLKSYHIISNHIITYHIISYHII